jgi:hypothetical protein
MREVVLLLCRLHLNAFTLSDDDLTPVGMGIYPVSGLINHDCTPNCVPVMHATQLQLRACVDIPAGAELRISYVDVADERQTRRAQLLERYLFNCTCERCEMVLEDEDHSTRPRNASRVSASQARERVLDRVKWALRCVQRSCPGWLVPWSEEDWRKLSKRLRVTWRRVP